MGDSNGRKKDSLKDKGFVYRVQSISNYSLIGSVNLFGTDSFVCLFLFFSQDSNLSL